MARKSITPSDREIKRFYKFVSPEPNSGCWLWTGACINTGYGVFCIGRVVDGDKRNVLAHRMSIGLAGAYVPDDKCVLHKCDNKVCVNPDHLYIGTVKDNSRDAVERGRHGGRPMPGQQNPRAKITEDIARAIYSSTDSLSMLAKRYGISKTQAGHIKLKKSWRYMHAA